MSRTRAARRPDKNAMATAVRAFLQAAGLDVRDPNLEATPRRVAEAWADEFLSGYRQTASQVLDERFPVSAASSGELVVVTHLNFRSMCPHHLLPYAGVAHLAYVPGREVVGFGRLSALVDTFAHRLILQEELARRVARSLVEELDSEGAACLIEAEQSCFRLRGAKQHQAVTHSEAYEGVLQQPEYRSELRRRLGRTRVRRR